MAIAQPEECCVILENIEIMLRALCDAQGIENTTISDGTRRQLSSSSSSTLDASDVMESDIEGDNISGAVGPPSACGI
jgi:hypothetical protein